MTTAHPASAEPRPSKTPAPKPVPAPGRVSAAAKPAPDPDGISPEFLRAPNEDDDGYDPYSDRRPAPEPLFERDPWA